MCTWFRSLRSLVLLFPMVLGIGQRPAPVASGDLNGDGKPEQAFLKEVIPIAPETTTPTGQR